MNIFYFLMILIFILQKKRTITTVLISDVFKSKREHMKNKSNRKSQKNRMTLVIKNKNDDKLNLLPSLEENTENE